MHKSSSFQLLPATGWFSSRKEPKSIIYSLTNLFVSTSVSCLFRKKTEKKEVVWIRQSETKLVLLVMRDTNLRTKKSRESHWKMLLKLNVWLFTIKNHHRSQHVPAECWGFFSSGIVFQNRNGSIATSSMGNLLPKPGPLQCSFQCLLDLEIGSKTICESWLSQYRDICALLTGAHALPRT